MNAKASVELSIVFLAINFVLHFVLELILTVANYRISTLQSLLLSAYAIRVLLLYMMSNTDYGIM